VSASNPSLDSPTRRTESPCSVRVGDGSDGCVGYSGNNIFDFDRWSRPPTIAVSGEKVMKSPVGTVAPDASEDSIASVFEKADVGGDALERGESASFGGWHFLDIFSLAFNRLMSTNM
jgi:hypothetical protein